MMFLASYDYENKSYSQIITDFFTFLLGVVNKDDHSHVKTAKNRSDKALAFEQEDETEKATTEWKKVFGDSSFPVPSTEKGMIANFNKIISNLQTLFPATTEEYLDRKYGVATVIDPAYLVTVDVNINQRGWRQNCWLLSEFQKQGYRIQKNARL